MDLSPSVPSEAVPDNTGIIEVETVYQNKQAQLLISDNGCGITPENKTRLFEPYFTSKRNGIGLGLATTLNILQSHNATVEVQSQVGHGSIFTITFSLKNTLRPLATSLE